MQGDGKMDGEIFPSAEEIADGVLALVHVDIAETEAV
jgi:hypothetical protein